MRLFDTPGADAAYDRWLDPPSTHEEDGCDRCHVAHMESGEFPVDGCDGCDNEIDAQVRAGKRCERHGQTYMDPSVPHRCLECEHEKVCPKISHEECS